MLDMGFIPDIERIFSLTPMTRQTLFYSATMAPEIERITNAFLSGAVKIEVARQATTSETIEQALIQFTPSRRDRVFTEKRAVLRALITAEGEACTNAIIFCNRKMDVDVVAKSLKSHGFNAAPIHGDLDQSVRTRTLEAFREGSLHLLVASDVAARGLDIPAVSHVFNFDLPSHPEDYVHRIGRTGRAGRLGKAFTIATPGDDKYLAAVEGLIKKPVPRGALPEGFVMPAEDEGGSRGDRDRGERDRGGRDDRGGRSGGRDRGRRGERGAAPEGARETAAVAEVAREERRPEPRPETRNEPRRDEPRRDDRHDRRNDRRDDSRDRVVGMGDHVPDFILRSFKIAAPKVIDDEPATGTEG
jgi:superfamily II DNA/RNA helicase